MKSARDIFQGISYLQYVFHLPALFYVAKIYYVLFTSKSFDSLIGDLNKMLLFLGIAISFSTLQDFTKTQNKLSKKVWESRRKGKVFLGLIIGLILFCLIFGIIGLYSSNDHKLREVALGLIVMGIGCIGMLKVAIEMYEYHRKD